MQDVNSELVALIRDSAAAIAPRNRDFSRIRALRFRAPGFDRQVYRQIARMGWIGLRLPEDKGGTGLGMTESVALYEELGRGLVPEPLIAATVAASVLAATDGGILKEHLSGDLMVATAWADGPDSLSVSVDPAAPRNGVVAADIADLFCVPTGATLRIVEPSHVQMHAVELQDGSFTHTVTIDPEAGRDIGRGLGEVFARAIDEAALGTAAYLLGIAEGAFAMTLEYLKQRKQFGQPLATFQALQHRAADLQIQLTLTRASVLGAAAEMDGGASSTQRAVAASRAKARAADCSLLIGREAIQLHGAIGYTDEYDVGLFIKKAMTLANRYGSAMAHRRRFIELTGNFTT